MKTVYGIQGPAEKVLEHNFPVKENVVYCTYDKPLDLTGLSSLFLPSSTWATGRNAMLGTLQSIHPDAEYFVLMDHDAHFVKGDFPQLERNLELTRPLLGFPVMSKAAQSATLLSEMRVQRAIAIDEQLVAIHKSVIGEVGVAPLLSHYDWASWYVACFVFEYICLIKYNSRCHQYNDIEISNSFHAWQSDQPTVYNRGNFTHYIQIVRDVLTAKFGSYDETLIEQLDIPPADVRIHKRQALAGLVLDRNGMQLADDLLRRTSI